ncbi:MAG: MBG domain-containing protein, partial [Gluconacetobacter sp.]
MKLSLRLLFGCTILTPVAALAQALPVGGSFVAGVGHIDRAPNTLTVSQSSERAVVNWQGFSIGAGKSVQFNNGSGTTLNRVTGAQLSDISGKLGATGSVFLINPNGVVVGPGGKVVVDGSFTASTRDTTDRDFMAGGAVTLSGASTGVVANKGTIYAKNGSVTLVGRSVSNTGTIRADHDAVAMVAGDTVILADKNERDGIFVKPKAATTGDVTNSGRIKATSAELRSVGGNVYALAGNHDGVITATGVVDGSGGVYLTADEGTVSVSGTLAAHTGDGAGGTIVANGHDVQIAGTATLDARAVSAGKPGGTVLVGTSAKGGQQLATKVGLESGAKILAGEGKSAGYVETSARSLKTGAVTVRAGAGGQWLTDPDDLTIDSTAASSISSTLNSGTNVTEQTTETTSSGVGVVGTGGTGAININAPVSWNSGATLALSAYGQITFNSNVTVQGSGAVSMTASAINFNSGVLTYTTQNEGSLNINGNPYTLIWTPDQLESIGQSGNYALANAIDLSGVSNFTPIGNSASSGSPSYSAFTGAFTGLGNYVNNLTINDSQYAYVGLFGQIGSQANIQAARISNANITATAPGTTAGVIAGSNAGTVIGLSTSGNITANGNVGGVFGENSGNIWYGGSYTTVTTTSYTQAQAGGFVGLNTGGLNYVNSFGDVSSPSVTGNLANTDNLGGVAGANIGSIMGGLAYGSVTNGQNVGGLVGCNNCNDASTAGTITKSSASGSVSNASGTLNSDVGGLVGYNSGTISASFSTGGASITGGNTTADGYNNAGGLIGFNVGAVSNTYAIGNASVSGSSAQNKAGGLMGATGKSTNQTIYTPVSVSDSFSTGTASATTAGGAFGYSDGTSVSNVYYDTETSGMASGVSGGVSTGVTGLTTSQMTSTIPSGFSSSDWGNQNNQTTPYLTTSDLSQSIPQTVYFGNSSSFSPTTPVSLFFSANSLYLISANLSGNYALGNDIDASAIGLFSAEGGASPFTGTFDGLGHTISNLSLNTNLPYVGLFAINAGKIGNLNLNGVSATGSMSANAVGSLVGINEGSISDVSAAGVNISVNVSSGAYNSSSAWLSNRTDVGGLTGASTNSGSIDHVSVSGSVSLAGTNTVISDVGGLIGASSGSLSSAYSNVAISVSAQQSGGVGGLDGYNGGTITNAYTTGTVTNTSTSTTSTGGLVGNEWGAQGSVSNVYATGAVSGPSGMGVGALFGDLQADRTYTNAYYNTALGINPVGSGSAQGTTGTTISALASALPTGFSPSIWGDQNGETPYLLGIAGNQLGYFGESGTFPVTTPVWRVQSTFGLQTINNDLAANYAMVSDIDAGAVSNFAPIGGTSGYSGVFDGQGHTISNLTINDTSDAQVGLFGATATSAKIMNVTLNCGSVTGNSAYIGSLVGGNQGEITNDTSTVSVSSSGQSSNTGGLVGANFGSITSSEYNGSVTSSALDANSGGIAGWNFGAISKSQSSGQVSAVSGSNGGLVGYNTGSIDLSFSSSNLITYSGAGASFGGLVGYSLAAQIGGPSGIVSEPGSISRSYATGNVTNYGNPVIFSAGGLLGNTIARSYTNYVNNASITDSYSTGNVSSPNGNIGGLVGFISSNTTISDAYSTGSVTGQGSGNGTVGASIGLNQSSLLTNVYFDSNRAAVSNTVGSGTSSGITGLTTLQWATEGPSTPNSPYSFSLPTAWTSGTPYPVISALPYQIVVVSGQSVYGSDPASGTWTNTSAGLDSPLAGYQSAASASSSVGSYVAWGTGAVKNGYQITYAGTNTITPASLTITPGNLSSIYGTTPSPSATNYSTSGLVNGDTITSIRITTAATGATPVGVYPAGPVAIRATMAQGVGLSNYTISYAPGTLTINPAALTIAALDQTSTYGQAPALDASAFGVTGLVNGDTVSAVSLTTAATGATPVGTAAITASAATGSGLSNYDITYQGGTLTIDPAALTVTALDQSSTYGQAPDLGTSRFSAAGLVNGDAVSSVTLATAATGASSVGSYGITAADATGSGLTNYAVTYRGGTLTIDPAALTVTALDQT